MSAPPPPEASAPAAAGARRPFSESLAERAQRLDTRVCLGLDPRPEFSAYTHPDRFAGDGEALAAAVAEHLKAILGACHDLIACCKPQSAFFEALGPPGAKVLADVMNHARSLGVPVLLDAKRGDIGSTAAAYAGAYLGDGPLGADALTINPYLGLDTLEPFIETAVANGRGLFVLVRTSNPGSADLQGLSLAGGEPVYQRLATKLAERAADLPLDAAGYSPLGVVVGAGHSAELAELREVLPRSWFLVPGYGAQGGTASSARPAFAADGLGAIVSASRSLTYSAAARATLDLDEIGRLARERTDEMRLDLRASAYAR